MGFQKEEVSRGSEKVGILGFYQFFLLSIALCLIPSEAGIALAKPLGTKHRNADVMEILETSLIAGEVQRSRFFFDPQTGVRFWVPWSAYQFKNPKQLESLVAARAPQLNTKSGIFVGGFFPSSAQQLLLKKEAFGVDLATNWDLETFVSEREFQAVDSEGVVAAYLPYLLFWFHEYGELKDSKDFKNFVIRLRSEKEGGIFKKIFGDQWYAETRFKRGFAKIAESLNWIPVPKSQDSAKIADIPYVRWLPDWKKNRVLFEIEDRGGLRKRILLQGVKGRILVFALYFSVSTDGPILEKVAQSVRLPMGSRLSQGSHGGFFSFAFPIAYLIGIMSLLGLLWYRRYRRRKSSKVLP